MSMPAIDITDHQSDTMTVAEFDAEYQRIRATYGDSRAEAGARFEQELARFFHRAKGAHWTQERIAERVDKSPQRIAQQLRFGAFLDFSTRVENAELPLSKLTEKQFRRYWERTNASDGNDNVRFKAVLHMLEAAVRFAALPQRDRVAPAILEHFTDRKFHMLEDIQAKIDHPPDLVKHELDRMHRGEYRSLGWRCDRKPVGRSFKYRFFPNVTKNKDVVRQIGSDELVTELSPIIARLKELGTKSSATINISAVAEQAVLLKDLLDKWTK